MPSVQDLYNQELAQGHREALATLRELLAHETDPLKRFKFASALLRARPVKAPSPPSTPPPADDDLSEPQASATAVRNGAERRGAGRQTAAQPSSSQSSAAASLSSPNAASLAAAHEGAFLPTPRPRAKLSREDDPNLDEDLDQLDRDLDQDDADLEQDDTDLDEDDAALDREADEQIARIMSNPDPAAAMQELHTLMTTTMNALTQTTRAAETS